MTQSKMMPGDPPPIRPIFPGALKMKSLLTFAPNLAINLRNDSQQNSALVSRAKQEFCVAKSKRTTAKIRAESILLFLVAAFGMCFNVILLSVYFYLRIIRNIYMGAIFNPISWGVLNLNLRFTLIFTRLHSSAANQSKEQIRWGYWSGISHAGGFFTETFGQLILKSIRSSVCV